MERLLHETAISLARRLVELVSPCLRPEERQDAFVECYALIRKELDEFVAKARPRNTEPSRN